MPYKVNKKAKSITVEKLNDAEKDIVALYINGGYIVKLKNSNRITENDIIKYFDNNKDTEGKAKFNAKKAEIITDKNGNKRKGGYLVALRWFKAEYKDAYEKLTAAKKK